MTITQVKGNSGGFFRKQNGVTGRLASRLVYDT